MEIIWLALLIVFAITEGVTVALVSIWFMGGALAALIAALCGAELWVQVVLFFAVSILLLLCLRPLIWLPRKPSLASLLPGRVPPCMQMGLPPLMIFLPCWRIRCYSE